MPYENLPKTSSTQLDGAFRTNVRSTQPKVLILGAATAGRSYELFNVSAVGEAEVEFGAESEVLKGVHEAIAQGADNVAVMRIGGHQGFYTATQATPSATLVITPEDRDDEILSRYNLVATADVAATQRILLWDNIDEQWVYDSDEILVINGDLVKVVIGSGFDDWTCGDIAAPQLAPTLTAALTTDFTAVNGSGSTMSSSVDTAGTDGTSMSLPERYAALAQAYHVLDWRDADIVVPKNVYVDDANKSDGSTPEYATVPVSGVAGDVLGYVWHYIYQGRLYTYMTETSGLFTQSATYTPIAGITITAAAAYIGPAGTSIQVQFMAPSGLLTTAALVGDVLQITPLALTASWTALVADLVATPIALVNGLITMTGVNVAVPGALAATPLAMPAGHQFLDHQDLTGDTPPAAVTQRFYDGAAVELRECNFGHQLASFLYGASASWKQMIGTISTKGPTSFDRLSVSEWIGSLPAYQTIGTDLAIDAVGDNGSGILGNKFLAGEAAYRDPMVTDGDSTDGLAYGGFIMTKGLSLPNGADFAYGILDSDEAVDSGGRPVDIGRHIVVTCDQPKHRNAFNGGVVYRGDAATLLAGKIATTPVNLEPIGEAGVVTKINDVPRIHATQLNDLARIRVSAMRKEEGTGTVLVSVKTAALPDSDYSLLTTTRCANRLIQGIRQITKKYIGKEFTPFRIAALNTAIEGYLHLEQGLATHQGAKHGISFSRQDKIAGRVKVRLRFIPPFTMRQIDIETSLAADESEL